MKQKILMLIIIAHGMGFASCFAQEKEYKLEKDGFEWYKISKISNGKKVYGAQDRNGNVIVPTEYDHIFYDDLLYGVGGVTPIEFGFRPSKDGYEAWFNKSGKCIIPFSKGYKRIRKYDSDTYGTYYAFSNEDGGGICDKDGKQVVLVKAKGLTHIECSSKDYNGMKLFYLLFHITKNNEELWGIADVKGNVVINPEYTFHDLFYGKGKDLISTQVTTTYNPLTGNRRETLAEAEGLLSSTSSQSNRYSSVEEFKNGNARYYKVSKGGRCGLIGSNGKVVVPMEMEALESAGTGYLRYKLNGFWGVMNYSGKIIIDTDRGYTSIGDFKLFNKRFAYTMNGYKGECDATGRQISKIKVDTPRPNTSVTSSSASSSTSSNTSNNTRSTGGTQTIVVEHKHDPVPMQVWKQCTGCYGSGMCQSGCGGSGWFTGYSGNSTRCIGCGGSGKCQFCAGQGGHYEVEYR